MYSHVDLAAEVQYRHRALMAEAERERRLRQWLARSRSSRSAAGIRRQLAFGLIAASVLCIGGARVLVAPTPQTTSPTLVAPGAVDP